MHVLTFRTPSKNCGARVFNGSRVVILDDEWERRYRKKVRRLDNRYANVILVTHAKASEHQGVAWWAIEDELHIEEVEAP